MQFSKIIANIILTVFVAGTVFSGIAFATDYSGSSFIIRDPVLIPGGGTSTSSNFQQINTVGQPVVGESTGSSFIMRSGFGYFQNLDVTTLRQTTYRWYDNINALQPTVPRAAENTKINIATGDNMRLRLAIRATGDAFPSASVFKLQFADRGNIATCAGVPTTSFADIGPASSSAATWVGYANAGVTNGAQVSAALLTTAAGTGGGRQTYQDSNNTAATPVVISVGANADAEWDWSLKYRGTNNGLDYCFRMVLSTGTVLGAYTVYPTVTVATTPPTTTSGGGGSGGFSTIIPSSSGSGTPAVTTPAPAPVTTTTTTTTATPAKTGVVFSGKASPGAKLTLLKDGTSAGSFTASATGDFVISLPGVDAGRYNFVLYGDDSSGSRSTYFTKTVDVVKDQATKVESVVIPPTLRSTNSKVKVGETLSISGQTYPRAKVKISVSGKTKFSVQQQADKDGKYFYIFDSGTAGKGDYNIQVTNDSGTLSQSVAVNVGNETVVSTDQAVLKYDLNGDGRVNLLDFSVLAFWFNKPAPTNAAQLAVFTKLDLNSDGKIDLTDASVLVSQWTG